MESWPRLHQRYVAHRVHAINMHYTVAAYICSPLLFVCCLQQFQEQLNCELACHLLSSQLWFAAVL